MPILTRLESIVETMVEGGFRRLFAPPLQPVEVARALERLMDEHKVVGFASVDVPSHYVARLNPVDHQRLASLNGAAEREAAAFLDRRAVERGLSPLGRIQVSLLADEHVARSSVRGEARFDAPNEAPPEIERTRRLEPVAVQPGPGVLFVAAEDGKELAVDHRSVSIGRGIDNDLVIRDVRVSRHHLSIEPAPRGWVVRDLQSTNGTFLDGERVDEAVVDAPVELLLGGYRLTLRPG
jgi:hypothetical protein